MKLNRIIVFTLVVQVFTVFKTSGQSWEAVFDSSLQYLDQLKYGLAATTLESVMDQAYLNYQNNPGDTTYAISLGYLAWYYELSNQYVKAEDYYKKSISARLKSLGIGHPEYINSISNLGLLYMELNRYQEAEVYLSKSVNIAFDELGEDHMIYTSALNNLAELNRYLGKFDKALELYEKCIMIAERNGNQQTENYANYLNNAGIVFFRIARFDKAESYYLKSLALKEKLLGIHHPEYGTTLNNLAVLNLSLGRFEQAEKLHLQDLQNVKDYYGTEHRKYSLGLSNLARFYGSRGNYEKAKALYNESIQITKKLYGKNHLTYGNSLLNLSFVMKSLKEYDQAEKLLLEYQQITKNILGENHWLYATSLHAIGRLYHETEKYDLARKHLLKALAIIEEVYGKKSETYYNYLYSLILSKMDLDENENLHTSYRAILDFSLNEISLNFLSMSEKEKREYWNLKSPLFDMYNNYVIGQVRKGNSDKEIGQMYNYQLSTKSILLNSDSKLKETLLKSQDSATVSLFNKWLEKKDYYSSTFYMTLKQKESKGVDLDQIESEINKMEKKLAQISSVFTQDTLSRSVKWKDIQLELNPGEAAIEMVKFKRVNKNGADSACYVALIITNKTQDQPKLVVMPKGSYLEDAGFKYYRKTLSQFKDDLKSYTRYWAPIQNELSGINKVYLSSSGIYNLINLNTLYNPDTKKYLIETLDIHLVTSTKDILFYSNTPVKTGSGLTANLFGNPTFNINKDQYQQIRSEIKDNSKTRSSSVFMKEIVLQSLENLDETETEVKKIANILADKGLKVSSYLNSEALEEQVKKTNQPTILHMATHGFFYDPHGFKTEDGSDQELSMLSSGLIFAGISNYFQSKERPATDDGVLTAYECSSLNLGNTELVVLSACETGLGSLVNGDGVYGLQRGLKVSGAKSILMSLWKVDDLTTQELMTTFYEEWMITGDKIKGFRNAQLKLKAKYPNPYYWGGFILVGENTVIQNSSSISWWYYLITGLLLLLISTLVFRRRKASHS